VLAETLHPALHRIRDRTHIVRERIIGGLAAVIALIGVIKAMDFPEQGLVQLGEFVIRPDLLLGVFFVGSGDDS
jgi:hypothetical protein